MAELAGLSIAANVAQFVVLGFKGVQYLYEAYSQTDTFVSQHAELDAVTRSIHHCALEAQSSFDVQEGPELAEILEQMHHLSRTLDEKLSELRKCVARGGRRARFELAIRALWTRSDIDQLRNRLVALRDQVSHLMVLLSRYGYV